jgi:hypothetical protein
MKAYIYISHIQILGEYLYTFHIIPFILSGLILYLAMIGSISLTYTSLFHTRKKQFIYSQLNQLNQIFLYKTF